jgi:hypothetical protein
MNNFSDILAIETSDQLKIKLTVIVHGNINYQMQLNGQPITNPHTDLTVDLFDSVCLTCHVIDVNDGAVEIKQLSINGTEIWQFEIPSPFYTWYHAISGQGWVA